MRKSLNNAEDVEELLKRIEKIREYDLPNWGKMKANEMLWHCAKILETANGTLKLREINLVFRATGIATKYVIAATDCGIPHNMPTYSAVLTKEKIGFVDAKMNLTKQIEAYQKNFRLGKMPRRHPLFGKMNVKYWGILEFKHLNHHLNQFGV